LASISDNPFVGLPLAVLQELQGLYVQVLKDIALAGQSYSFPGRTFTRADLRSIKETLGDINSAISFTPGGAGVAGGGGKQLAYGYINTHSKF
jgi:hypothetical protein